MKDTMSKRSQEDLIWGKHFIQFLGKAEIQPGSEIGWNRGIE